MERSCLTINAGLLSKLGDMPRNILANHYSLVPLQCQPEPLYGKLLAFILEVLLIEKIYLLHIPPHTHIKWLRFTSWHESVN